jgi:hypothetical protein
MKKATLVVPTQKGTVELEGWKPDEDCEFFVHKIESLTAYFEHDWVVTHVRSGLRVPMTDRPSRKEALELAQKLHDQCPSAALVGFDGKRPNDGDVRVKGSGNHAALVAEIKQVLGFGVAA